MDISLFIQVLVNQNLNTLQIVSYQRQDRCLINCNSKKGHISHCQHSAQRHVHTHFELQSKSFLLLQFIERTPLSILHLKKITLIY